MSQISNIIFMYSVAFLLRFTAKGRTVIGFFYNKLKECIF